MKPITRVRFWEVMLKDHPFIVDTIRVFLEFTGFALASSLYFTIPVRRDRGGRIVALDDDGDKTPRETFARFEIQGVLTMSFARPWWRPFAIAYEWLERWSMTSSG